MLAPAMVRLQTETLLKTLSTRVCIVVGGCPSCDVQDAVFIIPWYGRMRSCCSGSTDSSGQDVVLAVCLSL